MNELTRTEPELPAYFATRQALYDYRVALYAARQAGLPAPCPPVLAADALVDAYGADMHEYGSRYRTFAEWMEYQQTPQGPRRFAVVGEMVTR